MKRKVWLILVFFALLLCFVFLLVSLFYLKESKISKDNLFVKLNQVLPEEKKEVTLLAFGDLMLDRYVRKSIEKNGQDYPFLGIKDLLASSDLVLANLEGSFTDFPPKPLHPNNMVFTFDPKMTLVLKRLGFNLLNLANNHTLNFGQEGLSQSKGYLKESGINYFGDPQNQQEISLVKQLKGIKIGFVGYHDLDSDNSILEEIQKLKREIDFVIVYAHWGKEYQTVFSKFQQRQAQRLIDSGADVVFGSHPHVIQPMEVYKNKPIFYSLGNFLFDQTFSQKTQQGLGVKLILGQSQIVYFLSPTRIKNIQVNLLEGKEREIILRELSSRSQVTENIRKQILEGKIIFSSTNTNH